MHIMRHLPLILASGFVLVSCTTVPANNQQEGSGTSSIADTETGSGSSAPARDETYMKSLKHIGFLSADDRFVWCGKDGKYSMENGYGNQSYPLESADPTTFAVMGTPTRNGAYFQDQSFTYYAGRYESTDCTKMKDIDNLTFTPFIGPLARDKDSVYVWGKKLADVDSASLKLLKKIRWPTNEDKNSFDVLYLADKTSVYFWYIDQPWALSRIVGADPKHFSIPKDDYPSPRELVKTL